MRYRGVLLDLDGVFHVGDSLLPGAVEALDFLRTENIPFRIVTNTTTRSRASLVARLRQIGLSLNVGDVITAPRAAVLHLRGLTNPRCRFLLTGDAKTEFVEFAHHDDHPDQIVLGDIEEQVNYPLLNTIFNQMMDGAELIALHKGRFWETPAGLKVDLGLLVSGLEYTTGKTATIIGKPSPTIFALALDEMGLPAEQCAMIGDDLHNDVLGAQAAGLTGVLMKTGKYRPGYEHSASPPPDRIIDSIAALPDLFR